MALLSGILSFLVISQLTRELKGIGATDLIGTVIVVAIVRELGPLLTALVVVGRSGTAIAAELATNQVMGEVRALEFLGIDPKQYLQEMVRTATQTLVRVQSTLRDVTPDIERTLTGVASTMGRLDSMVNRFSQRGLADSVSIAVANTNRLLLRLDSLAHEAHSLATENRSDLRLTVANLTEASRQLNNFVDQMSRRPFRALTGVKPLPPRDTVQAGSVGAKP